MRKQSSGLKRSNSHGFEETEEASASNANTVHQALLDFYDPEKPSQPLRFGDTVSLIPDGVNGIVAYAGAKDARPWVEILNNSATTPPNMRDCHFRIRPRAQYAEAKRLSKMQKEGRWDGGRNLPLPEVPSEHANLDDLAEKLCELHGLEEHHLVVELLKRQIMDKDEAKGNAADCEREQGQIIRYGDAIELQHVTTGKILTLTKQQAHERASKKVCCEDRGSEAAFFSLRPALKAYSAGGPVKSGHRLVLSTVKRVGGMLYTLHIGHNHGQSVQTVLKRHLQIANKAVVGCAEVNATTGEKNPTAWRMVLFESYKSNPVIERRFEDYNLLVRAEQIICFYHKEAEAYLEYRTDLGDSPVFRASKRVSSKARKKASWMWKVESLTMNQPAGPIQCNQDTQYRIKHIITNKYLIQNSNNARLELTDDYLNPGTSFSFKAFAKDEKHVEGPPGERVERFGLVYIQTPNGFCLHQEPVDGGVSGSESRAFSKVSSTDDLDAPKVKRSPGLHGDTTKETHVTLSKFEGVSEGDVLLVMPVSAQSFRSVVQVRRAILSIADFSDLLSSVKETTSGTFGEEKRFVTGPNGGAAVTATLGFHSHTGFVGEWGEDGGELPPPPTAPVFTPLVSTPKANASAPKLTTLPKLPPPELTPPKSTPPEPPESADSAKVDNVRAKVDTGVSELKASGSSASLKALPTPGGYKREDSISSGPLQPFPVVSSSVLWSKDAPAAGLNGPAASPENPPATPGVNGDGWMNGAPGGTGHRRLSSRAMSERSSVFDVNKPPHVLPQSVQQVLAHTASCYVSLKETLTTLILNATFDEDPHPMSRDGPPNRLLQKLLRELQAIDTLMRMIQLPFAKGVAVRWMGSGDERFKQLVDLMGLGYRLLKQIAKDDHRNALALHQYVGVIRDHLGKGMSCTITLKEIYMGKRNLLSRIKPDLIVQFVELLKEIKDPRYIDFLLNMCHCDGSPMPAIQEMISDGLFERAPELLPVCTVQKIKNVNSSASSVLVGEAAKSPAKLAAEVSFEKKRESPVAMFYRRNSASNSEGTSPETIKSPAKLPEPLFCLKLTVSIPGEKDDVGRDILLNIADFGDTHEMVKGRDYASYILTAAFGELEKDEKIFRYFVRCINLYGKLCLGRNQASLAFLLENDSMPWDYPTLLTMLGEEKLPALVRSRLTSLMLRLYVDRDPQTSKPQVLYTRTWSKVVPEESDMQEDKDFVATLPVCTTGFTDLSAFLLQELPFLGGAKGKDGAPSLNLLPTYGQLELISAQLEMVDQMLDFGFFTKDRDSIHCDFQDVQQLFHAIFSMVDTRGYNTAPSKRRESHMLVAVRSSALELLIRILNLRANYRISVCLDVWERLFEQSEEKRKKEGVAHPFFEQCLQACFGKDIISTSSIKSDRYQYGQFGNDAIIEAMINLTGFRDHNLTAQACALMMRHMSQRTRVTEDLKLVQVLVFPAAVKMYHETEYAIKRLTTLRRHISADRKEAYDEATHLLQTLTQYITLSLKNPKELVSKNQRIMLNRELDNPVVDILRMKLERDLSFKDLGAEHDRNADPPKNPARRDLFQVCFDYLKMLCKDNTAAQVKLFPMITVFADHVGVEQLNVADTICEIVRDNAVLISQVPETFFRTFINAIQIYGRKARWLRFFEVFLEINGVPFKRNQNLILRLVVEDFDNLVDLECDYTESKHLPRSDPRYGMTMLDLMHDGDHRLKVNSLVKYHFSSINLLALSASGKNAATKSRVMQQVSMDFITSSFLWVGRKPDGSRDTEVDIDGVHAVRLAWMKLMMNVYLSNLDYASGKQVLEGRRIWTDDSSELDQELFPGMIGVCLMEELRHDLALLSERLRQQDRPRPEVGFRDVEDNIGWDVQCHVDYSLVIIKALSKLFGRLDLYTNVTDEQAMRAGNLRAAVFTLFRQLKHLRLASPAASLLFAELLADMNERGVSPLDPNWGGNSSRALVGSGAESPAHFLQTQPSIPPRVSGSIRRKGSSRGEDHRAMTLLESARSLGLAEADISNKGPDLADKKTAQSQFHHGWNSFKADVATRLGIDPNRGMVKTIFDMAMMMGSRKTYLNGSLTILREFMRLMCDPACDRLVQLNGLKVVRAILYLMPDAPESTPERQEVEYARLLNNQPPLAAEKESKHFAQLQIRLAKLGCIDLVVACMSSENSDIILAAVMLSVTLLEGGCRPAQDMLGNVLSQSTSQPFFQQIHQVLEDSVAALKTQKRKIKQAAAERDANKAAGIASTGAELPSLGGSLLCMTELIKMMRRMCMGQHMLQDILRNQKLNQISINFLEEVVKYLVALEPELTVAIQDVDVVVVEGAIRGFLMLSDAMRGPNHLNQKHVAQTGLMDLGDRIFGKIHFEEPPSEKKDANPEGRKVAITRNLLRSRLKGAVTTCLMSFLEGVEGGGIPEQMLTTIQFSAICVQMTKCHAAMLRGDQLLDHAQLYQEGIGYYFVLSFLKVYDLEKQYIEPNLARHKAAAKFFEARTGFVEIVRQGRLERVLFALPDSCVTGGPLDKPFNEMYACDLGDPDRKNQNYLANLIRLIEREEHQSRVRASILAFTVTKRDQICTITFIISLTLTLNMVLGSYVPFWRQEAYAAHLAEEDAALAAKGQTRTENDLWFHEVGRDVFQVINMILGFMMLLACLVRALSFVWAELPNIVRVGLEAKIAERKGALGPADEVKESGVVLEKEGGDEEVEDVFAPTKVHSTSVVSDMVTPAEVVKPKSKTTMFWGSESRRLAINHKLRLIKIVISSPWCGYEFLMLFTAVLAVVLQESTFTVLPLFEICFWKGSKTVIDAVWFNLGKMIQTLLLGLLVMYLWSIMGLWWLSDFHQEEHCNNMLQCFMSYFYRSMRGDGLSDLMLPPVFAHNIVDFTVAEGAMLLRAVWDLCFQFLFLYVLIAIITGIVIDAFGGLRDKKDAEEEDIKTNCFVCNLGRFTLDQKGIGFDRHIVIEHNPRYYLFFLLGLKQKSRANLTSQETYVLDQVWPERGSSSYRWLPREQTFTLEMIEEDQEDTLPLRILALESKVALQSERIESQMTRNEQSIEALQQTVINSLDRFERVLQGGTPGARSLKDGTVSAAEAGGAHPAGGGVA